MLMTKPTFGWVLGLFFLVYGCGTDGLVSSDHTGSGGAASTGGASGGQAGSGGAPAGGSGGSSDSGGTAPVGGSGGSDSGGSGGSASGGTAGSGGGGTTFILTSPAFEAVPGCSFEDPSPCAIIPDENVSYMDRPNVSPELSWTGVPPGTQSFAVVLYDASYGQAHWVLWNIPADAVMLAADVPQDTKLPATPAGSEQANANFADTSVDGYFGPHLPCNVFEFQVFALALPTFTPADPDSAVLVHIELQKLGEPLLGIAKLAGRSGDYDTVCQ